jgi:prepilin-type N-terminal cleavage/methylation domain-containing protein
MRYHYRNQKGFTLAEAMIATVILSVAAVSVLLPFTTGAILRAEGTQSTLASKLAGDLIEEITSLDFDQIVSTYNYTEAKGSVRDAAGAVFTDSNYANFSRKVATKYVYVPQESGDGAVKYIMATVAVYYDGRSILTVNRLITR